MKKVLGIIPVVVGLIICSLPITLPLLPAALEDIQIQASLNVYSGAEALGMVKGEHYGSNLALKKINYWTSDPFQDVMQYYQNIGYDFAQGQDEYGQWFIAGYDIAGNEVSTVTSLGRIGHGSFCSVAYTCVTISLVDTAQRDFYRLGVLIS